MSTSKGEHPKRVGDISQAKVMAALMVAGKSILLPFGENTRYDLVIDEGDRFVRLQCKTGRLGARGVIKFSTASNGQRRSIRWAEEFELGRAPLLG
ncbi:MAG: hypothetical protein EXR95_01340 [Gemmatimonadetes bacterium]|nr:hypothetical protein [Gemmatimonadota bacterium]